MNKETITFIHHTKEKSSDSSYLSDEEIDELVNTFGFITSFLEINTIFTKDSDMLVYDKTRLNKQFKESLKQERIAANMEFPNCKSKHNLLKINTNNMEKNFLPLIPIKITGIFKKAKDEHLIDSNIKKVKNNLEILSGMLSDGLISDGLINNNQNDKKIKIHINNNIKNIVLSNLILQDQSEKIFPQASKIGKFQKTIKIFE